MNRVTSSEFMRYKGSRYNVSFRTPLELTRCNQQPLCHFECFHCARAKMKMYREANRLLRFSIQRLFQVATRTDEVQSTTIMSLRVFSLRESKNENVSRSSRVTEVLDITSLLGRHSNAQCNI